MLSWALLQWEVRVPKHQCWKKNAHICTSVGRVESLISMIGRGNRKNILLAEPFQPLTLQKYRTLQYKVQEPICVYQKPNSALNKCRISLFNVSFLFDNHLLRKSRLINNTLQAIHCMVINCCQSELFLLACTFQWMNLLLLGFEKRLLHYRLEMISPTNRRTVWSQQIRETPCSRPDLQLNILNYCTLWAKKIKVSSDFYRHTHCK